jgi:hypothetical protein
MFARQTGSSDTIFAAYNSNISAGTSNTINIPQVAGYTGNRAAWTSGRVDHVVFTFTNTVPVVGRMYVNGVLNASVTSSNVFIPEDGNYTCYVPGNAFGSVDANMSVYDFRIVNGILSASQVAMLYRTLSGNNVPVANPPMVFSGASIFSQLSVNAVSSVYGIFSLRAVNGTTAKAVQVKRSSDNATQDFYADRLGNLLTAPVTGQTLQSWLGGSTGNAVTWYDQSGQGRNATGTRSVITQTSNVNQKWAVNPTNGGLSLSGGTFLNGTDFTITCTTKRLGTQGNDGVYGYGANTSWVAQASVPTTYGDNTRFGLVMPNAGSTAVTFNDSSYSAAFSSNANVLPSAFVGATEPTVYTAVTLTNTNQRMYINGTANGAPISTLTQLTANASTGFTIGTVNYYGNFLGEIGELLIFNNALSTSDISTLYSAR